MIPKIIHYCWFGGQKKTQKVEKYIQTWMNNCPGYEIKEWNESNFNVYENKYCREAYKAQKWAFVSDYARLKVLLEYGGIYLDTDVEVIKSFDNLLNYNAFMCFESDNTVSIGTLGVKKDAEIILKFLEAYDGRNFYQEDGTIDTTSNLEIITDVLIKQYNLILNGKRQILDDNTLILPMESFIAKDYWTGWILMDESTYAIHHYAASWINDEDRIRVEREREYIRRYIREIEKVVQKIAAIKVISKYNGKYELAKKIFSYLLAKVK